ncbi:hypothetical protein BC829DRAFT_448558 [Chytridium lagenaria]|nr:hypothetical protein BC829DRAFT_448558 [Chytridium lagenaria]
MKVTVLGQPNPPSAITASNSSSLKAPYHRPRTNPHPLTSLTTQTSQSSKATCPKAKLVTVTSLGCNESLKTSTTSPIFLSNLLVKLDNVRPGGLQDVPGKGEYKVAEGLGGGMVAREDVAHLISTLVKDPELWKHKAPVVVY